MNMKFVTFAILSTLGAAWLSDFLYRHTLVPHLNQYIVVPTWWWIFIYSPFGLCSLLIGMQVKIKSRIPVIAVMMALAVTFSSLALAAIQGQPPGHDMSWSDYLEFNPLVFAVLGIFIEVVLFSCAMYIGYAMKRSFQLFRAA